MEQKYGTKDNGKFIDISEHQGNFPIKDVVVKNNLSGVILRSGFGGYQKDKQIDANVKKCQDDKIPFGVYHFAYPNYNANPLTEAKPFVNHIKTFYKKGMPLFLDVEGDGLEGYTGDIRAWIKGFINYVNEQLGCSMMLYSYTEPINIHKFENMGIDIWYAYYGSDNGHYNGYIACENQIARQYSQNGRLSGYNGNLDVNVMYSDHLFSYINEKKLIGQRWHEFENSHGTHKIRYCDYYSDGTSKKYSKVAELTKLSVDEKDKYDVPFIKHEDRYKYGIEVTTSKLSFKDNDGTTRYYYKGERYNCTKSYYKEK